MPTPYTPAPSDAIALDFGGQSYVRPASDAIALDFSAQGGSSLAPIATDDAYSGRPGVTLMVPAGTGVLANDASPASLALSAVLVSQPASGTVTLQADGSFGYAPDDNIERTVTWTYKAKDTANRLSSAATVTITLAWPPAQRYDRASAGLPFRGKYPARLRSVGTPFARASRVRHHVDLPWDKAAAKQRGTALVFKRSDRMRHHAAVPWAKAGKTLAHSVSLPSSKPPSHTASTSLSWTVPPAHQISARIPYSHPPVRQIHASMPWTVPPNLAHAVGIRFDHPPLHKRRWWLPWQHAPAVQWHPRERETPIPPTYPPPKYRAPRGMAAAINLACPQPHFRGFAVPIPIGPAACYFAWPRPRTYIMLNSASVTCTLTGHVVEATAIDISESLDDMFHAFRIDLADPDDLPWLQPTESGPIAIEINVNGHLYTGIVEDWSTHSAFPGKTVQVTGRALAALLDAPYAPPRAYVETETRTAHQLVDRELQYTGYTADYGAVDWSVTAGAWHYDSQTAAQAVQTLARASGSVARSHPYSKTIELLPRYPVSPWEWDTTSPDKTVVDDYVPDLTDRDGTSGNKTYTVQLPLWPASEASKPGLIRPGALLQFSAASGWKALVTATSISATLEQSGNGASALIVWQHLTLEAPPAEPRFNSVLVSGQQIGVSAPVVRTGTAGDKPLPQIVDPLITDATVQRERGRNALAAGGDGNARNNLWLGLRDLIPSARIIKGNITAANSDGSYTIDTADGATIRARPTGGQTWQIHDGVMVRNGYIIDQAPSLPGTTQYV